jgi:hypothetical protein
MIKRAFRGWVPAALLALLASSAAQAAQGTRAYIDGNGAAKTALTGSNGTGDTTGVTAFDVNGNPLSVALDGTDATGVSPLAGGVGIRGWLSSIDKELSGPLSAILAPGSNVIGAVTQSAAPWTTTDSADGPVAPGTPAAKSTLAGCVFNATLPTMAAGQQAGAACDPNSRIMVATTLTSPNIIATSPTVTTVTAGSAYAVGQSLAGLIPFPNALPTNKGVVQEVRLWVANGDTPAVTGTMYLFNAAPTATTATDHSAAVIAFSDAPKLIAKLSITAAADPSAANVPAYGSSAAASSNTGQKMTASATGEIWGVFVIDAATSFATAGDVIFELSTLSY